MVIFLIGQSVAEIVVKLFLFPHFFLCFFHYFFIDIVIFLHRGIEINKKMKQWCKCAVLTLIVTFY